MVMIVKVTERQINISSLYITFIFYLEPPMVLPLSFGADIMDEGAFAQVSCIVSKGDQPLQISWSFHGGHISSNLGIITTPIGNQGSMLLISSVKHDHRGNYTCTAKNDAGVRSQTVTLNVNGNYNFEVKALEKIYFL